MHPFQPTGDKAYPISLVDVASGDSIVLQDPSGDALPIAIQSLQVPGADIREVVSNRPFTDGTVDTTSFAGGSAATIALRTLQSPTAHLVVDTLRAWLRPSRRSYLVVQRIGWPAPRRLLVRADALAAPVTSPGAAVAVQLAWKAPDGVWEALDEESRTIFPGTTTTPGRTYPKTYPWSYTPGIPPGSGLINVGGTVAAPPIIRLYGPATAPGITNATTGQTIAFKSSFAIPAGGYVAIHCADTISPVLANDDPSISRYDQIDWSQTDLWFLQPGTNQIQFTGTALSAVTQAVITWRERTA